MKPTYIFATKTRRSLFVAETLTLAALVLAVMALSQPAALAQCTLTSPDTWSHGSSSNWNNGGNWSGGVPNSSSTNVCITDGSSAVTLDTNASVASLQLASGNALDFNQGTQLLVYGSQILNAGQININGGGGSNTYLYLQGGATTTLSGGGTVTLSTTTTGGGGSAYLYMNNGTTLVNVDNMIQDEGIIYNNSSTITNQSSGTINASSTGSPLVSYLALEYGAVNNAGLLEATNSGDLQLYATTINNQGGNITANGSGALVELQSNTVVQGGAFNTLAGGTIQTTPSNAAYLDGSTSAGAVTINGAYLTPGNAQTFLRGSIVNNGTLQVNGRKEGWVFPSKRSATGHLCPNLSRPFAKMRKECGISTRLVPYSARHTFGTAMLEMTGDVVFVGKLMGHKNPLTTIRYLHPSLHKAKELIDRRNEQAQENLRHSLRHSEENEGVPDWP